MSRLVVTVLTVSLAMASLAGCSSSGYALRNLEKSISAAPAIEFMSVVNLPRFENGAYTVRGDGWINEVEVTRWKSGELWSASLYEKDLNSNRERITVYSSRDNTTISGDDPLDKEVRRHWKQSPSFRFIWDIASGKAEYAGQKQECGKTWDVFVGQCSDPKKTVQRTFEVRVSLDRTTWIETYTDKNGILVCTRQGIIREDMVRPEWYPSTAGKMVEIFEGKFRDSLISSFPLGQSFRQAGLESSD